jgi:Flp pilus assembly protein TadG
MDKSNARKMRHRKSGSFIAETPAILWVLFILVVFPMVDAATVALRYTFVLTASREAAMAASRAKTYMVNSSLSDLSASNAASATAYNVGSQFTGIKVTDVDTRIVSTNLSTQATTRQETVLTTPADTDNNLYSYETTITADVQPLVTLGSNVFGHLPGLTAPINVKVTSRKICENT